MSFQKIKYLPESAGNLKSSFAALKKKVVLLFLPQYVGRNNSSLKNKQTKKYMPVEDTIIFHKYSLPSCKTITQLSQFLNDVLALPTIDICGYVTCSG